MNFNVWNIKDMLSIPSTSGTTKSSSWANNPGDYSSLSDSQFLFGSQFCPESSETLSAPLDVGVHLRDPKPLQKGSLDNEPSIFTKYQTKPQLFEEDINDGGLFPLPLPVGKSKGLLEQFEEKKKIAKDKCDSETLYSFISHVRESVHKLQTSVEKSEEHLSSRSQSILDSLETVAKTLQETARAQRDLVLETAQDKGRVEQAVLELRTEFQARQAEIVEMKSGLKHLEAVAAQQSKDVQQLCEQLAQLDVPGALAELKSFLAGPRAPTHVRDSTSQTSPPGPQPALELRVGALRPGESDVWGEGAKRAALPEEAVGEGKRSRGVRDKAVQTSLKSQLLPKTSSENCGGRKLVAQGALRLLSLDVNNFVTSPKCQTKGVFSRDPCEQRLVTGEHRRRGRPPRSTHRGRPPTRRQEQPRSTACAFSSRCPQLPGPGSQGSPPEQQEPRAQPLCRGFQGRNPTQPARGGALRPRALRQLRGHSPQDSSQGDPQMSWFSDLNPESPQALQPQQPGKAVFYHLGFDSSDESA
ncbi:PREDICTED: coiled-coil domain-containing protein 36 [Myotis brandtii]|uniref:coiled-coil domain-containing protein 36 n=1 Tax=Myotis brandtii TaxID=109478 RepID=UPI0007044833|nr:PREDICTED: coiled-coil domain-containing protein 36 [Myotis brandtii]